MLGKLVKRARLWVSVMWILYKEWVFRALGILVIGLAVWGWVEHKRVRVLKESLRKAEEANSTLVARIQAQEKRLQACLQYAHEAEARKTQDLKACLRALEEARCDEPQREPSFTSDAVRQRVRELNELFKGRL